MICTPYAGNAHSVRYVSSDGSLSRDYAYSGDLGGRPDLVENATE